jgi:transcriptional repressor NrdR
LVHGRAEAAIVAARAKLAHPHARAVSGVPGQKCIAGPANAAIRARKAGPGGLDRVSDNVNGIRVAAVDGNAETQVVETRMSEDGDFVRRRRQCAACEKRFTTYERPDVNYPVVVKKDGRRIEFDRSKLQASMNLSLRKRPVSTEQVDSALERIEEKVLAAGLREISSHRLGELVMRELKKLDKVAYVRFASVYRSFEDIDEFKSLVDEFRR